ncbi:SDR family NAD(P)-dependent oxidoreductase [Microbacterium enclense]|uniref:SDR family NAD(P)-dependent oxidoreductase n=1 Tax=Microbacterium enclense TaxID=993073 RepID=A0A3S3MVK8_9MICO|nr:SDR family NAD(P)-dependent oxidoreductase [Microbacterium enclense]RWR16205.1 SDR family NAD(P)-dependent oxidoreductase [Microbacterium enclense]
MNNIVLISGASSGFGAAAAGKIAANGDIVYAGMRDIAGRNAEAAEAARKDADERGVDLRPVELDVSSDESVGAAVSGILAAHERIDVLVHNAGHMVTGPVEAFTPAQVAEIYDTNVISTQRLNRAVLPGMRQRGTGYLMWVGSSSTKGGTPPYLGPYFAAKAAEDALAVSLAKELVRWGIETTIVVPGSFTSGTNHFAHSGHPEDSDTAAAYELRYAGLMEQVAGKLAELFPADVDASIVSDEMARLVALRSGERPFRVHLDPADDGSGVVSAVADHIQNEFLGRLDLGDLVQR